MDEQSIIRCIDGGDDVGIRDIDISNVRITHVSDAPPITDWIRSEVERWIRQEYGAAYDVEITYNDKVDDAS